MSLDPSNPSTSAFPQPLWSRFHQAFFVRGNHDPGLWLLGAIICVLAFFAILTIWLMSATYGIQGGAWGWSGLPTYTRALYYAAGGLAFGLFVILSDATDLMPACWGMILLFGTPVAVWIAMMAPRAVQAVNVRLDHAPPQPACVEIVEDKPLGCSEVGCDAYRLPVTRCSSLTLVRGWPQADSAIHIDGDFSDATQVCFTGHPGRLDMPWIDHLHATKVPPLPVVYSELLDAYRADVSAASRKYRQRWLRFDARIVDLSDTWSSAVVQAGAYKVYPSLDASTMEALRRRRSSLNAAGETLNEPVTLECRNQWPQGDQPGLSGCRIVKAGFKADRRSRDVAGDGEEGKGGLRNQLEQWIA
ncbi:hypothetical protein [Ralstonia solanacearum]|uniref:hypothetical protein n=1 Tax=Ralstonia solanacearum TaxID=305 RepID=UPI000B0B8049|nr:hypothetical protein [Ralstonia solanacearum]MCG3574781.1 hypothetical protein [Ralstonia solanacearum]MCL9826021.1 hypothetical protein [Ralstonia solanacearum]MCL9830983.1 hypothetical protein [Ralstonia solanacearum]MCL9835764.1 hypothetical protein [Ralstonia solanacearum]MCL9840316.1 hypothetical protein [Ralstonia solanacearum]